MKRSFLFIIPILLLSSCQTQNLSSSTKNDESTISFINSSVSVSSFVEPSTSYDSTSITPITSSITPSTSISSETSVEETSYNPDGSRHLPIPKAHVKETWGSTETKYSFLESFPEGFQYIYGHKILNQPNFYQDDTKGWKISVPNSSARMGVQTPLFTSDLKIEIRLYLAGIYNSNNKVDQEQPWLRVYGFNQEGRLTQVKEVQCPNNFYNYKNSSNPINFYMSGEDVNYLEIRFTAAPYKGSQCYNFAIKEIGFKTFPYAYEE